MKLFPNKAHRDILSWLGSGAVVVIGATWTLFTYLHDDRKPPAPTIVNNINALDEQRFGEQVKAVMKPFAERLDDLTAAVALEKGVPIAMLRSLALKFGVKDVPDENLPFLLEEKADEYNEMKKQQLAQLQKGPADVASAAKRAEELLDKGDFDRANMQLSDLFTMLEMQNSDYQNAQTIATQVQSDNQKQQMERWRILQDTQSQMFRIQEDVTVKNQAARDKAYKKWDQYIRGCGP